MGESEPPAAAGPSPQHSEGADVDAGTRGKLTVREKVAQRLAIRATLDTPGVLPYSSRLTKMAGRSLPQAQLTLTGNRVSVQLTVAVLWPARATDVAGAVQRNVAHALSTMAGLDVDRVDVTVEQFSVVTANAKRTQ